MTNKYTRNKQNPTIIPTKIVKPHLSRNVYFFVYSDLNIAVGSCVSAFRFASISVSAIVSFFLVFSSYFTPDLIVGLFPSPSLIKLIKESNLLIYI